nr:DUF6731 family protein [Desulfuribacillus stibiiarsenatis]
MDDSTIQDTLDDIQEYKGLFSKAEISKKNCEDTRVEIIDLFEHKAHDICTFRMERRESLNHLSIAKEMWMIYSQYEDCENRRSEIINYLRC